MRNIEIHIGDRFGHLTVIDDTIQHIEKRSNKVKAVLCECDCHNHTTKLVSIYHLIDGHTTSCGCTRNQTHKLSHTKIYQQYYGMRKRCEYPKHKEFDRYGGRGISVCEEWKESFENFYNWAINNGFNDGMTIDRINNDGNYSPDNCRFITLSEQQNNKSNSIFLTYKDNTYGLKKWSEITGISYGALLRRYHINSDPENVLKGWEDLNE